MNSQTYYFPLMFLLPDFEGEEITTSDFKIVKRKWDVSIFDLATLATKHKLHLAYQAMDVFLSHCNCELAVSGKNSEKEAVDAFNSFRLLLYTKGVSPFLSPFFTTHSINEYSAINRRDSGGIKEDEPEFLKSGLMSENGTLEAWPLELSFQCITINEMRTLTREDVLYAANNASKWMQYIQNDKSLSVVENVVSDAPKLHTLSQSLLHVWTGIESLFPNVSSELTFKISLYMTQLSSRDHDKVIYHKRLKKAYGLRSKVAHGSVCKVEMKDWEETWGILLNAVVSIMEREGMPNEASLIDELLSSNV